MSEKDLAPLWAAVLGLAGAVMLAIPAVCSFPENKEYEATVLAVSGSWFIGMSFIPLVFYFFRVAHCIISRQYK